MSKPFLARHCLLKTRDLDEAREFVGRSWERHESQLVRGNTYAFRWHQISIARAGLAYFGSPTPLRVYCGPVAKAFHFTMHESGAVTYEIDGRRTVASPDSAVFYGPGHALRLEVEAFRTLMLSFDATSVETLLVRRAGRVPARDRLGGEIALDAPPASALRSLCRWAARELDDPETWLLSSPQVGPHLDRAMLSLFVDSVTFGTVEKTRGDDLAEAQVARIEAWLDAHFAEPVTVDNLAAQAGVGVRAVQAAFRRLRGCSPMEALARRRLDHARRLLQQPDEGATVTTVAGDCGFFHFGRFAARYRAAYGEKPSQTLARARAVGGHAGVTVRKTKSLVGA